MNGSVITVDGGRCMVSIPLQVRKEITDQQNAGIHDGIKIPDELLTYT